MNTTSNTKEMSSVDWAAFKEYAEEWQKTHPKQQEFVRQPCPNCGYCPHCGRGGHQTYPYPWGTTTITYLTGNGL